IGSLANKVKSVFHAVAKPVNRAIDKIVGFITRAGKKLWAKLKNKNKPGKTDSTGRAPEGRGKPGDESKSGRSAAALREAMSLVKPESTTESLRSALPEIKNRHQLRSLTLIVDSQEESRTKIHFKAVNSPGIESSQQSIENEPEDEETKLIDNGQTSFKERREVLDNAKRILNNEEAWQAIFTSIKQGKPGRKKAIFIFQKIVNKNLTNGYQINKKPTTQGGLRVLDMHYLGLNIDGIAKVDSVQRAGKTGGAIGSALIKPLSLEESSDPVPALALDFYIPPSIVQAHIKGVGTELFKISHDHFGAEHQAVAGEWYQFGWYESKELGRSRMSSNLKAYIDARREEKTEQEAVRATWTYRRAREIYGCELEIHVVELHDIYNPPNNEMIVQVLMKPKA
ncbi:hypothetical protein ACFU8Q_40680, partial [Streptomyces sp. NPDC057543]